MRPAWQTRRERATHTDDWLMTYADMITLLLCFFAIFLSVSLPQEQARQAAHAADVARPPEIVNAPPLDNPPPAAQAGQEKNQNDEALGQPLPKSVPDISASLATQNQTAIEPTIDKPPTTIDIAHPDTSDQPYAALLEIINRLKSQVPSSIEQQGDRITTLQIGSGAFFASGSATLSTSGKALLKKVALNINSAKYQRYRVTVEGHTDDTPIRSVQFPSNWELSTARAASVVHFFLQQGILAPRLRAAGYADTFPIALNRDAHGKPIPENQARNRRVVIKLEKIDQEEPNR